MVATPAISSSRSARDARATTSAKLAVGEWQTSFSSRESKLGLSRMPANTPPSVRMPGPAGRVSAVIVPALGRAPPSGVMTSALTRSCTA